MKVLIAASEAVPFCKTGGLADVAGALPLAFGRLPVKARLVLPKYKEISESRFGLRKTGLTLKIPVGDSIEAAELWEGTLGSKVAVTLIDNPRYFGREGLYSDAGHNAFLDNDERFIFFSRAVLETAKALDFRPDVIHCHDWQTALIPAYLAALYSIDAFFLPTATLLTIHNLAYQGEFPETTLPLTGFSRRDFTPERLEFYGQLNFLKAGLVNATLINTVSPTYACEIRRKEFGHDLEGVLNARQADLSGILNGLDTRKWDPAADPHLTTHFSLKDPAGKSLCKQTLQRAAGLDEDPEAFLIGVVSRLDRQKGLDLIAKAAEELLKPGTQIVMLGSGDPLLRKRLEEVSLRHPGRFVIRTGFDEPLAHLIYAGADLFLMPSRFEPCGLGQMIAMRYGAIPVVTPRGGLLDTVEPCARGDRRGTGFIIPEPTAAALEEGVEEARQLFRNKVRWAQLVHRAMSRNFPWSRSIKEYVALYQRAAEMKKTAISHAS